MAAPPPPPAPSSDGSNVVGAMRALAWHEEGEAAEREMEEGVLEEVVVEEPREGQGEGRWVDPFQGHLAAGIVEDLSMIPQHERPQSMPSRTPPPVPGPARLSARFDSPGAPPDRPAPLATPQLARPTPAPELLPLRPLHPDEEWIVDWLDEVPAVGLVRLETGETGAWEEARRQLRSVENGFTTAAELATELANGPADVRLAHARIEELELFVPGDLPSPDLEEEEWDWEGWGPAE